MSLSFPSSPINGQSYTSNGIKYKYNAIKGYWSTNRIDLAAAGVSLNNDATITVTAGTGLSGGGNFTTDQSTNETLTLSVDLNSITTSTTNGDGDYFVVVDTSGNQYKLTKSAINVSEFSNDAGYLTSADGGNAASVDGYSVEVVTALPSTPDANTIYLIT